jgi:hypothetical protein
MFRRISRFKSAFDAGVAEAALSVEEWGLPGVWKVFEVLEGYLL